MHNLLTFDELMTYLVHKIWIIFDTIILNFKIEKRFWLQIFKRQKIFDLVLLKSFFEFF